MEVLEGRDSGRGALASGVLSPAAPRATGRPSQADLRSRSQRVDLTLQLGGPVGRAHGRQVLRPAGALSLLLGCTPTPDRFTETWAVCEEGRTETCDAALLADFGAEGSTEPLLDGLWELVRVSSVAGPLEESELVQEPFIRWIESAPGETSGEALYNRVSDDVEAIVIQSGNVHTEVHTVFWNEGYASAEMAAATILHESRHCAVGAPHVPCSWDPDVNCDQDWKGAFGSEAGFATWAKDTVIVTNEPNRYEWMMDAILAHIDTPD